MPRIGVLGDIHSNLPALEAVLESAGACDEWWCVGDVVGYGPYPNECVREVAALRARCVAGNHDLGSTGRLELDGFNVLARIACEWTAVALAPEGREFLQSLKLVEKAGEAVMLAHGSPRDPVWEYLTSEDCAARSFPLFEERICFIGHTHVPMIFSLVGDSIGTVEVYDGMRMELEPSGRYLINTGSVGQPRDGDKRACRCIFDTGADAVEFERIPYDIGKVQWRMAEEGLPKPLSDRLERGR